MSASVVNTDWIDSLRRLRPCTEAMSFAEGCGSFAEAWATCARADWMLWLLGRLSGDRESAARKRVVLCACACARTALVHVPKEETRPLAALETAERWARGENGVTLRDVRDAAEAAVTASVSTGSYFACAAANASAYAAYAVAAYAANAAAYSANAAAAIRNAATGLADLVRQHYPEPPVLKEAI